MHVSPVTESAKRHVAQDCTILVPTYNRPHFLNKLIRYLLRDGVISPHILVLDSSQPAQRAENRALLQAIDYPVAYQQFPETTLPFEKFAAGSAMVDTSYSVIAADDDVLLPEGILAALGVLEEDSDCVAAHGAYFNFFDERTAEDPIRYFDDSWHRVPELQRAIMVSAMVYSGQEGSEGAPIDRMTNRLLSYEASTYAVFRSDVLAKSLAAARCFKNILFSELTQSLVPMVYGKIRRIDAVYALRNTHPSHPYSNWHPIEMLARNPATLLEESLDVVSVLLDVLVNHHRYRAEMHETLQRQLTLGMLTYLSPFLDRTRLVELLSGARRIHDAKDLEQLAWAPYRGPRILPSECPMLPAHAVGARPGELVTQLQCNGSPVPVRFQADFLGIGAGADPAHNDARMNMLKTELERYLAP